MSAMKRPRRIRNRPEQVAHIAVMAFLRRALPHGAQTWHTPNSAKRSATERAHMRKMGLVPGFPDIAILIEGRFYFAEMKASRRGNTYDQDIVAASLTLAGANDLGVWRSIDDCEAALRAAGIRLRATAFGAGTRAAG